MRNLKRALSLVLASVMVLGLMIVGSSAKTANFTDANDVDPQYTTAIDVVTAIGVFEGMDDGTFAPTQTLRRAEAAKLMCVLLLGEKNAEKLDKSVQPFSDVPANQWYTGYISHCAQTGILHGYGDGNFGPEDYLTGVQFGKLLLGALGYNAEIEGYANDPTWSIKVASAMITAGIDVDDVQLNDGISREQAAQMVFNTLQANMVTYGNRTNVTVGDVNVTLDTKASSARSSDYPNAEIDHIKDDSIVQFAENYFKDLEKTPNDDYNNPPTDSFGRPETTWEFDGSEIASTTHEPEKVLEGHLTYKSVYNSLVKSDAETSQSRWIVTVDGNKHDEFRPNYPTEKDKKENGTDATFAGTGNGSITEIYVEKVGSYNYIYVSVINEYAAKVDDVKTSEDVKNGDKPYITISPLTTVAGLNTKFETEEAFKQDDVVIYTYAGTDIKSVKLADSVSGEITRKVGTVDADNFSIDGTVYYPSLNFSADDLFGVEYTVKAYLDSQGNAIYVTDINKEETAFAYVIDAGKGNDKYSTDSGYGAKLLLTDNSIVTADIVYKGNVSLDKSGNDIVAKLTSDKVIKGNFIKYSINDDNEYVIEIVGTSKDYTVGADVDSKLISKGKSEITIGGVTAYANDKTIFLVSDGAEKPSYSIYTGIKNIPSYSAKSGVTSVHFASSAADGKLADVIFIEGVEETGSTSDDVVFILGDSSPSLIHDKDGDYYVYTAYVGGQIKSIHVDDNVTTKFIDNKVYAIKEYTENDKGIITKATPYATSDSKYVEEDGTTLKSGTVGTDYDSTNKVYKQYFAYTEDAVVVKADDDSLTISSPNNIRTDKNDKVSIVLNSDGLAIGIAIYDIDD